MNRPLRSIVALAVLALAALHDARAAGGIRVWPLTRGRQAVAGAPAAPGADARTVELALHLRERLAALQATPPDPQRAALGALERRLGTTVTMRLRPETRTPRQLAASVLEPAASGFATRMLSREERGRRTARAFLAANRALLRLDDPDRELALAAEDVDDLGRRHLRFAQQHRGVPVWPAEVVVHLDARGNVDLMDGAFVPTPAEVDPTPALDATAAVARARATLADGDGAPTAAADLIVYAPGDAAPRLAWRVELARGIAWRWLVVVDAQNGDPLTTIDLLLDENVVGSGLDLFDTTRQLNVWHEGQYFLVDTSKQMYDPTSNPPSPDTTRGAIVVLDAHNQPPDANGQVSISQITANSPTGFTLKDGVAAAFALSETYDYYLERHARNSIDGSGGSMLAAVRFQQNFKNAFWNGSMMVFGDALPYAGAIDVVGHELTHGVTQHTANLVYQNQSGALNEAMSDIFGESVETRTLGTTDWLVGGALPGPVLRNMADPGALTIAGTSRHYPSKMSELIQPNDPFLSNFNGKDNGGVHLNSGIINHAFYLLADGLPGGGIGIQAAARIFYRALTTHLVANSQFTDARLAAVQSAKEIFGDPSTEAAKTGAAFDAVEITDGGSTPPPPDFPGNDGADSLVFLRNVSGDAVLGRLEAAQGDPAAGVPLASPAAVRRPAVNGAGTVAAVVSADEDLCLVRTIDGLVNCLKAPGTVHSVAMSPDGQHFGFVLNLAPGTPDNLIRVVDINDTNSAQTFPLRAPQLDGGGLDTVLYADTMDFTADNRFLVYDAFNQISVAGDNPVTLWSIYALDVQNDQTLVLIPPTPGVDIGNPALSQTSDNFLAFDAFDQTSGNSTVTAANLTTGALKPIGVVTGDIGIPSYTGDDAAIVYAVADATPTGASLVRQPVEADRITASGSAAGVMSDAKFGVVYRRGTLRLCTDDAGCADTDPCTNDTCDPPTGCHHDDRTDVGSPACVFEYGLEVAACGSDPGFVRLQAKLTRGHTLIDGAAAAPKLKKARKLLKQSSTVLRGVVTKAGKLAKKGKLTTDCRDALGTLTEQVRARIATVLSSL